MSYEIKIFGLDILKEAMKKSPQTVYKELTSAIKTSVNIVRPIMGQEAPAKSGKLRRNIVGKSSGLTGTIGPDLDVTPYAWYVHEGTGPYIIRPRMKKALYWNTAPGGHPWKLVHHPGIKANPFVSKTYDRIKEPVQLIFQQAIKRISASLATK